MVNDKVKTIFAVSILSFSLSAISLLNEKKKRQLQIRKALKEIDDRDYGPGYRYLPVRVYLAYLEKSKGVKS